MQIRLANLPYTRISAVDGADLDDNFASEYLSSNPIYPMSNNEIACILSHRIIWNQIIHDNLPAACIIEDDVQLSPNFGDFIKSSDWIPEEFDIVKIETMLQPTWISRSRQSARDRSLHELRSTHPGTAAYIVSLNGCRKLLALTEEPDRAADDILFELAIIKQNDLRILQLVPALCAQDFVLQDTTHASDIASDRQQLRKKKKPQGPAKLLREISRPYFQITGIIRRLREDYVTVPYL